VEEGERRRGRKGRNDNLIVSRVFREGVILCGGNGYWKESALVLSIAFSVAYVAFLALEEDY
jgi:hypothetical protein